MKERLIVKYNQIFRPKITKYHDCFLKLNDKLISDHIKNIVYNFSYERQEISILRKVLEKEDSVMEIGAGMGFLSIYCSKFVGGENVVAYEANPYMIELIKDNYKLNDINPTIKNIILSDKNGTVDFYIEKNFYSSSTIKRSDDVEKIAVKTENINEQIKKYRPNFLIVDIEGGEVDLIKKINFKASHISKLLIELHPHVIGDNDTNHIIKNIMDSGFLLDAKKSGELVFYFYRMI